MSKSKQFAHLKEMAMRAHIKPDGTIRFRKIGITANRVKKDPAFFHTRRNAAEFGHAAKTGQCIRHALAPLLDNIADATLTGRLVKTLLQAIKTDIIHEKAPRNIAAANLTSLAGFECNAKTKAFGYFHTSYQGQYDPKTRRVRLRLNSTKLDDWNLQKLFGATHCKLIPVIIAFNTVTHQTQALFTGADVLHEITHRRLPSLTATLDIIIESPAIAITAFAFECYKKENNHFYRLANAASNCLSFVGAFHC